MNIDDKKNNVPQPAGQGSGKGNRLALFLFIGLIVMSVSMFVLNDRKVVKKVAYSTFLTNINAGEVKKVDIIDQFEIIFELKGQSPGDPVNSTNIPYLDPELLGVLREKGVELTGNVKGLSFIQIIFEALPLFLGIFILWLIFRQAQGNNKAFSFGRSKAKRYNDSNKKTTFTDVAGQKEAKYELTEVVDYLKNPQKFVKMGARIPKGVLLVGMPGTGKTLLAKAVAGEADVPFFHMSGSDFVEMFVGVGASRVRDLFEQGRRSAPCIIFIDELDAVGRTRGAGYGGGHDEREQTLNQMLVEMDGFDTKDGVIILAATNRPDVLDTALLRPGRFDRQVVVAMPDVQERADILGIHMKKVPVSANVDIKTIARATPGTSGADLANLVNEATLFAVRKGKDTVEMDDFEDARDKVLMGVARKSMFITDEEKKATAIHESGHALLHYYLDHADPLHKVTIIPRGRALGIAFSLPENDKHCQSKKWLLDKIVVLYGGYAAEQIVYGETTNGTSSDIRMATDIARRMVCEWGMAESMGPVAYGQEEEPIFIGKEIARHKDYSEQTARHLDEALKTILDSGLHRAIDILNAQVDKLKKLADELMVRETLDDAEIRILFGFEPKKARD